MSKQEQRFLIGLDYGSESARGVLIDAATGEQIESLVEPYPHGIMSDALPLGARLPRAWALQDAADYVHAARVILSKLGRGRNVEGIGLGFTASSPLPARRDGTALSALYPNAPHAYVKLWKHGAAQLQADRINARGGAFLDNFGGKLSGEWLLAKAVQMAEEAPDLWAETDRFIEGGDWLVWQLTGVEARSLGFAAYKAQYSEDAGYPSTILEALDRRLASPHRIGSAAGSLTPAWREATGISGRAVVAVAVIDSHVVLPAIGAVLPRSLVGALGTSAVYLYLNDAFKPLPKGIEGVAFDGSVQGLWCYEAGQAGFGDTLAWFVRTHAGESDPAQAFQHFNQEAAKLRAGDNHLVAIDWWSGNRVPLSDSSLSGLLVGLTAKTGPVEIYRALMESLCFGARSILDLFVSGGLEMDRVILTSGLAQNNPLLVQIMANVLGRTVEVPSIANPTAVGAAIHGAVAAGLVRDYAEGAARYGARSFASHAPDKTQSKIYDQLYTIYARLAGSSMLRDAMHDLNRISAANPQE